MKSNNKAEEVLGMVYETDGWLIEDYENKEEFIKDVVNSKNLKMEFEKLSEYFKDIYIGVNKTNSNNPKKHKERLESLICELDYVGYDWIK